MQPYDFDHFTFPRTCKDFHPQPDKPKIYKVVIALIGLLVFLFVGVKETQSDTLMQPRHLVGKVSFQK